MQLAQGTLKAFYINLADATERRNHMEDQLANAMLAAERVEAVDHKRVDAGEFDDEYVNRQGLVDRILDEKLMRQAGGPHLKNSTVACYLSHVQLLQRLSERGPGQLGSNAIALVLEDDVAVPDDWVPQLKAVLAAAPDDWTVLKVSGWGDARDDDRVLPYGGGSWLWQKVAPLVNLLHIHGKESRYKVYKTKPPFVQYETDGQTKRPSKFYYAGSSGYMVRGSSLQTVIQHLRSQRISDFDEMLLSAGQHNAYEFVPHVIELSGDHLLSSMHKHEGQKQEAKPKDASKAVAGTQDHRQPR